MGLTASIQNGVRASFRAMGDLAFKASYVVKVGEPVYQEDGSWLTPTKAYPLPTVVLAKFTQREVNDNPALATTAKMLFPTFDLPTIVSQDDRIVDPKNKRTWDVVKLISDPADSVTILSVRSTS